MVVKYRYTCTKYIFVVFVLLDYLTFIEFSFCITHVFNAYEKKSLYE